jgi:deoxyribodipyrimidine photo-lyase
MKKEINQKRCRQINKQEFKNGPIIYWMSREQRVKNNWSLLHAQNLAIKNKRALITVFTLSTSFLGATSRQYNFMINGLQEVEKDLSKLNIPFILLIGDPVLELTNFIKKCKVGAVVSDFDPLRIKNDWREKTAKESGCAFFEVDAHNIIPCWLASNKAEFGAYTIRPKIKKLLAEFLTPYPTLKKQLVKTVFKKNNWTLTYQNLKINKDVTEVKWIKPGEKSARKALSFFIKNKLEKYNDNRNNPNLKAQSQLSPYLHFGHISAQEIALKLQNNKKAESFLEELIIRKELSDNFCYYQKKYDSIEAFPNWAKETIAKHQKDKREYLYSQNQLENYQTHDDLWNAAQKELVDQGTMPGYLRMYWAKKILEWTKSAAEALKIAIYLNDKYQLDGRDPNGYAGIAWSIGGVHDRAWFERPIFGKIRYMNYNGCRSKFDIIKYIKSVK